MVLYTSNINVTFGGFFVVREGIFIHPQKSYYQRQRIKQRDKKNEE